MHFSGGVLVEQRHNWVRQTGRVSPKKIKLSKKETNECGLLLPCHHLFARGKCVCYDNLPSFYDFMNERFDRSRSLCFYLVVEIELKEK